jgi:PAS domain S-box-containing protein
MVASGPTADSYQALQSELADLRERLREAEETLSAIRDGEVDAVVVRGSVGQQVYTLENADRPYRALIEQMQDGAVTVSADGAILYCNQRFASLVGTGPERIIGTPIRALFPSMSGSAFDGLLDKTAGIDGGGEFSLRRVDGSEVSVNVSLTRVRVDLHSDPIICGVVSDLTTLHLRSIELRSSNAQLATEIEERKRAESSLQLALDAAGMGSWDYDFATGTSHRSPRHDQIFGHPDVQANWSPLDSIEHYLPEDRERVATAFKQASDTGAFECEARIRRLNDGQVRWLRVNAQTFYQGGKAVRIAGVVADVTDRRAVEERLRQAQKIEAVGQLTGGVAHDFNNLLQVISGGLQIIDRIADPDRRERVLHGMRQATQRGSGLSRQLLAFSRAQSLSPRPVDLVRQVTGMRELLDRSLRGDVQVNVEFAADLWAVEIDAGELELVILNLALNARDAMPKGGTITIRGENAREPDEELKVEHIRLSIIDTGCGMAPDVLAHVFEPFFTTKEVGKGSGLGLAQAHGFARASGGAIRITSALGSGTTVTLLLPRTLKAAAMDTHVVGPAFTNLPAAGGQVLLVEDDDEVAALTMEMIEELGYRATRVATAEAALGALANGRPIDIVFSDVMMPGAMNGVELALEVRRRRPRLPVLLTSGYAEAAKRTCKANGIEILSKPFRMEELRDAFSAVRLDSANPM